MSSDIIILLIRLARISVFFQVCSSGGPPRHIGGVQVVMGLFDSTCLSGFDPAINDHVTLALVKKGYTAIV